MGLWNYGTLNQLLLSAERLNFGPHERSVNGPPGLPGLSVIEERCR